MRLGRSPSAMYSPERVDRLKEYCEVLTENAVTRHRRVVVEREVEALVKDPVLQDLIKEVLAPASGFYPRHNIDLNLLDDVRQSRVSLTTTDIVSIKPEQDAYCRYAVAMEQQFGVTDSADDLVVCESPYIETVRSYLGSPVVVRSQAVGVLCVYADQPRAEWTKEDRIRISEWAGAVAQILENALNESTKTTENVVTVEA